VRHPPADGPQHPGTYPGHAFQRLPAADAVIVVCHCRLPRQVTPLSLDRAERRFIPAGPDIR
jgi:hypothetical protein